MDWTAVQTLGLKSTKVPAKLTRKQSSQGASNLAFAGKMWKPKYGRPTLYIGYSRDRGGERGEEETKACLPSKGPRDKRPQPSSSSRTPLTGLPAGCCCLLEETRRVSVVLGYIYLRRRRRRRPPRMTIIFSQVTSPVRLVGPFILLNPLQ